jgi:DNA mismatch endonuclease (patch repair protein)
MVFQRARLAVFVDGCFWHGCPEHFRMPSTNTSYWELKIAGNMRRDTDTDTALRDAGWLPLRVWEHDDIGTAAKRIAEAVAERYC